MTSEGYLGGSKKKQREEYSHTTPWRELKTPQHPTKKPAIRKTPGKLFKRLFCGPSAKGKDSFSETSLEGPIDSNSTGGSPSQEVLFSVSTVPSSSYLASFESSTVGSFNPSPRQSPVQTPPPSSRRGIQFGNMKSQDRTMSVTEAPDEADKSDAMSSVLSVSQSPDTYDVDVYLPHPSSSFSDENGAASPRTPTNTSRLSHLPMKTPGMAIPTPQHKQSSQSPMQGNRHQAAPFPHPLRTVAESPHVELTRHVNLSQSASESQDGAEQEEEDAFLPQGFKSQKRTYTWEEVQRQVQEAEQEVRFQLEDEHLQQLEEFQEQVEQQLQQHGAQWKEEAEAEYKRLNGLLRDERVKTQQKHLELLNKTTVLSDMETQLSLNEETKKQLESSVASLHIQMEHDKTANDLAKELHLNQLHQQIQQLQGELDQMGKNENHASQGQLRELEAQKIEADRKIHDLETLVLQMQNKMKTMELDLSTVDDEAEQVHVEEMIALKAANHEADGQIKELQSQLDSLRGQASSVTMEELVVVKAEKAAAERKLQELQEQWDARTEIHTQQSASHEAQLEGAKTHIDALEQQLEFVNSSKVDASFSSDVSHEEFFAARAEVETLRVLRDEDLKEKSQLQARLTQAQEKLSHSPRYKQARERKVEIGALTVEVLPSPVHSFTRDDAELEQVRSNLETTTLERNSSRAEIAQLKQEHAETTRRAVECVRLELEDQVQSLKNELDRREEEYSVEKRSLKADLSVQEIEELTSEVEALKNQHEKEKDAQRESLLNDHEAALHSAEKQLAKARLEYEQDLTKLVEEHAKEKLVLQLQIDELKSRHDEDIEIAMVKSKEESETAIQSLQEQLDQLRIEYEDEKIEIIRTSSKQADELQTKMYLQQQQHDEEMEGRVEQIKELESQLETLRAELENKGNNSITEEYLQQLHEKFNEDVEGVKANSKKELDMLHDQLEAVLSDKAELATQVASLESKLVDLDKQHMAELEVLEQKAKEDAAKEVHALEATVLAMKDSDKAMNVQVSALQAKAEADQTAYATQICEVRDEHNKEIDDLLKQLDLVEAEHNQKYAEKEKLVQEKETVIAALGIQLSEAEKRIESRRESQEAASVEVEELKALVSRLQSEVAVKADEIELLAEEHKRSLEDEEILREKACEEAREEMIQRAEVQFEHANAMYKKLKHEFDHATGKIASLETELQTAQVQGENLRKKHEAREADLTDELAEAKASMATSDLHATRKAKQYRADLELSRKAEIEIRQQLDQAQSTSRSVQKTLATMVADKERLIEENKELKAVCEELMELVEGGKGSPDV